MKKYLIGILAIIVLIAAGHYVWTRRSSTEPTSSTSTSTPANPLILPADQNNPQVQAAAALIVGNWQSTDDSKFFESFGSDGQTIDSYAGTVPADMPSPASTSTWNFYTNVSADAEAEAYTPSPGVVYIEMNDGTGSYHYGIVSISTTTLSLVYLERGGTLNFTRVQ
jgi:hypothetical protein